MMGKREIGYSAVDSYTENIYKGQLYSDSNHGLKK